MGKPQGMEFLANAIRKSESIEEAFFVLVGRGTEKKKVKNILKNSRNVLILDNLPRDEYEKLICNCDVGIVSLDHRFTIPNYPSRILSYMEYRVPVLAATDKNTDLCKMIKESKCGYWCESKSIKDFYSIVKHICKDSEKKSKGENGREYMEKTFSIEKSVKLLEEYAKEAF